MTTTHRRPPRAVNRFNKVAATVAGRRVLPVWALVKHRGRRSGTAYETPVAIIGSTQDAVYLGLPFGRQVDWVRNLRAAGGGTLVWKGTTYTATAPVFVDREQVLSVAPLPQRQVVKRWPVTDYLRLTVKPVA